MHLRVQPGAGDGGERPLAAVRAVRRRPERAHHPRLRDAEVQGVRLRDDDELRGVADGDPEPERVRARKPRPPGVVQEAQERVGRRHRARPLRRQSRGRLRGPPPPPAISNSLLFILVLVIPLTATVYGTHLFIDVFKTTYVVDSSPRSHNGGFISLFS